MNEQPSPVPNQIDRYDVLFIFQMAAASFSGIYAVLNIKTYLSTAAGIAKDKKWILPTIVVATILAAIGVAYVFRVLNNAQKERENANDSTTTT